MKVLVATEIRLYRDGVAAALAQVPDVELVVCAATGAAAVLAARRSECDVALLDMALSDSKDTVAALHAARPDLKVVALAVPEDGPEVIACAQAGIAGFISRDATLDQVGEALRSAVRGEALMSGKAVAGLLRHIAGQAQAALPAPDCRLTRRELEVVQLLQSGMTNRQIARALDLQLSTVKNHVHNVLTKRGAAGRAELGI